MRAFAALSVALHAAPRTTRHAAPDTGTTAEAQLTALRRYLALAAPADAAWAVYYLAGGKLPPRVPSALLRAVALAEAAIPRWLFDECQRAAGDLADTIAHVLPPAPVVSERPLSWWIEGRLLPLRGLPPEQRAAALRPWFGELGTDERWLLVKLVGGGFRAGVDPQLLQRALAGHAGLDTTLVAQRMAGYADARTPPSAARLAALVAPASEGLPSAGQPYPFCPARTLAGPPHAPDPGGLGPRSDWLVEWQYDGLRAQLVRRAGALWLWSRAEALVTERFPEVAAGARALPEGTVLDGELLVWRAGRPAPVPPLQQRLKRKTLPKALLAEAPVRFMAHDLLEQGGDDIRQRPQHERRQRLAALLATLPDDGPLMLSPEVSGHDWADLAAAHAVSMG